MSFLHLQLLLVSSCHKGSQTCSSPGFAWWLHPCDLQVFFCCSYLTSQELYTVFLSLPCYFTAFGLTFLSLSPSAGLSTTLFCSLFGRQAGLVTNIATFQSESECEILNHICGCNREDWFAQLVCWLRSSFTGLYHTDPTWSGCVWCLVGVHSLFRTFQWSFALEYGQRRWLLSTWLWREAGSWLNGGSAGNAVGSKGLIRNARSKRNSVWTEHCRPLESGCLSDLWFSFPLRY